MPFLVSPGVQVNEKDQTNVVSGVATTNGAFAGVFQWGPVMAPFVVTSENELVSIVQKPIAATAQSFFTAANFLAYSNSLLLCRVDTAGNLNATLKGTGVKINNEDAYDAGVGVTYTAATHGTWAAKYPGIYGNSIRVSMADAITFAGWQYNSAFDNAPGADELHVIVIDADGRWTGTAGTVLEKYEFLSMASDTKKADLSTAYYAEVLNRDSAYVWWIGHPTQNTGTTQLNWGATKNITPLTQTTSAGLASSATQTLSGANASIKVGMIVTGTNIPAGTFVTSISGTTLVMSQAATGTTATPVTLSFSQFQTMAVSMVSTTGTTAGGGSTITISTNSAVTAGMLVTGTGIAPGTKVTSNVTGTIGLSLPVLSTGVANGTTVLFSEGTGSGTLSAGADDLAATDANRISGFALFADAQMYDISLIPVGKASASVAIAVITNVAEVRKDCMVFVSPEKISDGSVILGSSNTAAADTVAYRNAVGVSSSYAVMDSGYKYQYDRYNDVYRWIPLNGDIAGLTARAEFTDDAWFSPAGFSRGQIKNCIKLAFNPNQTARDTLYKSSINPVVTFPGQGTVLYGDKTMLAKPSAFDRINVRRLFIVLEKAIANAAKFMLFEFNDAFTQAQFRNMVEPFLRDVQGRRGINSFKVICDSTNNTQQVVDTNNFVGDIYIAPARSINFITLNFIAMKTGAVQFTEIGA
jgi:hypothetical protein